MLKHLYAIFEYEFILLLRRPQEYLYPLGFFILFVCLFPISFSTDPEFLKKYISACIWLNALFASLISMDQIFFSECEAGHLEQLILSPIPLPYLVLIKLSTQWLSKQLPIILCTPLLALLFHLPLSALTPLMISLFIGTPILSCMGCLGAALTQGLRQQGVLLTLLILPLVTPVLILGISISEQYQMHLSYQGTLTFLAGLCLLSITLTPWAISAALRLSVDE
jgi:heme exporter protein B